MFTKLSNVIIYYQNYHLTKHKYQYRADNLRFFDVYDLCDLRKHHIKRYAQNRRIRVTNATINRELSFARASINLVMQDYEIELNNPFNKMKFVEDDHIPNYITREQFEILLNSALSTNNYELHDFILLLTMTGCRPKELLTLNWCDVHIDKRLFIVRNYYSKSKKTMYKYLNDVALNLLINKKRDGKYVFMNLKTCDRIKSFKNGFRLCKKRAGINCTLYDLRHTYASWLVQSGVSIYTVKDLLGHKDIGSTMRYAHLDYAQFVDAVQKLN